jgi:hypothetical protein
VLDAVGILADVELVPSVCGFWQISFSDRPTSEIVGENRKRIFFYLYGYPTLDDKPRLCTSDTQRASYCARGHSDGMRSGTLVTETYPL